MNKTTSINKPSEMLSEALKASVERGLAQIEKGEIFSHKDVMKRVKKERAKKTKRY